MTQTVRQPALREAYEALDRGELMDAIDAAMAALPEDRQTPELHMSGVLEAEEGDVSRVETWLDAIRL